MLRILVDLIVLELSCKIDYFVEISDLLQENLSSLLVILGVLRILLFCLLWFSLLLSSNVSTWFGLLRQGLLILSHFCKSRWWDKRYGKGTFIRLIWIQFLNNFVHLLPTWYFIRLVIKGVFQRLIPLSLQFNNFTNLILKLLDANRFILLFNFIFSLVI